MKSGVKGIVLGMAMLTMYGVHARVEDAQEIEINSNKTIELGTGFAMGTGAIQKMSQDGKIQVQSNLPEDVCNSKCTNNIHNILKKYSEELKDTTITITDGKEGVFARNENDIYISMDITEEILATMID